MSTVHIHTEYLGMGHWTAVDMNSYDGAREGIHTERGIGETEQEAINDLLEQLEEADVMEA